MTSFAERLAEHRRLTILRGLASSDAYSANEALLQVLVEDFAVGSTRDQIRTELSWLREQGLVTLREVAGLYIASLTQRGLDIAAGRATAPGVARPSPAG